VPIAEAAVRDDEADALFRGLERLPSLVIAISGGPDSTALLLLAAQWAKRLKRPPNLLAVTIDHGLRPQSAAEAVDVKRLARRLGVAHRTLRWRGRKPQTGLQEAARLERYRLLAQAAAETDCAHILTAHTLDDQAETVFFRLARGSGIAGLGGIAAASVLPAETGHRIFLVRPLLRIAKSRLIATLRAGGLAYSEDPSNTDPRFTRARLRTLLPALAREGLDAAGLARLAFRMRRANGAIEFAVDAACAALAPGSWSGAAPIECNRTQFTQLPAEVGLRLLGRAVAQAGDEGPVELGKLEVLYDALREAPGRLRRTLAGALVSLTDDRLRVDRAPARRMPAKRAGRKARFTK
jgi:tRNA(Ile)-lysidine synthase